MRVSENWREGVDYHEFAPNMNMKSDWVQGGGRNVTEARRKERRGKEGRVIGEIGSTRNDCYMW